MATATAIARWHFDEKLVTQLPADDLLNVSPLSKGGAAVPAVTTGYFGKARTFSATAFFAARPMAGSESKLALTRSVTCEAVLKYTPNATYQTIASHGRDTSSDERQTWCFQLWQNGVGGQNYLVIRWTRTTGLTSVGAVIPFTPPSPSTWMHVVITREWLSPTSLIIRAYVNGEEIGNAAGGAGDIDDGLNGEVTIGARYNAGYVEQYVGDIDEVEISDGLRTAEEVRQRYRRLFYFPALGYQLVRSMLPPGESYSTDPSSVVQRELAVEGFALAYPWAKAAELRDDWLPDRAWFNLERWEALTGNRPLPGDSIATRRLRVTGFLRKVHGYNKDQIKSALGDLLQLSDPNIVITETSNMRRDDFSTGLGTYLVQEPRAGTISASGGDLRLQAALGVDIRQGNQPSGVFDKAVRVRIPFPDAQQQSEIAAAFTLTALPVNTFVGVEYRHLTSGDYEFAGFFKSGASTFFVHLVDQFYSGAVFGSSLALGAATTYWARLRHIQGTTTSTPAYRLDGAGYDSDWIEPGITSAAPSRMNSEPGWACVTAFSSDAALATALDVKCQEYRIWVPRWRGVFEWAVYRDPAIAPTNYDRKAADALVKRIKPAHTHASVIEALTALVDSHYTRVDGEPVG